MTVAIPGIVVAGNLGNEFDIGGITPDTIRLRIGAGLTRAADGTISVLLGATTVQRCLPVGWANVNADGTVVAECGGVAVTQTGIGTYTTTPPAGALTAQVSIIEGAARDDVVIHMRDFLAGTVVISEQDNGGASGALRDRAWTVTYFGAADTIVTGVTPL